MQIDPIKQYEEYCQETKAYLSNKEEWISFLRAFKYILNSVEERNNFSSQLSKALKSCLDFYILSIETDSENDFAYCLSRRELSSFLAQTIKTGKVLLDSPVSIEFKKYIEKLELGKATESK